MLFLLSRGMITLLVVHEQAGPTEEMPAAGHLRS